MKVGFLGAGAFASNMAHTMFNMRDTVELYAVAARDLERAKQFGDKYGFQKAYGSYEDMLNDDEVELVYICTAIALHYEHIKMCLAHGKHVLCEKGFVLNQKQAAEVLEIAEKKNLLLTEAIWTRYMPSRKMIDEILDSGIIGNATSLCANLGYSLAHIERLQDIALGGGVVLDLTIYTLNFACMAFKEKVTDIHAVCTKTPRGVDGQDCVTLVFENGKIANLFSSFVVQTDRRGVIYGDKGYIEIQNINNCEKITVYNLEREIVLEKLVPPQITGLEYEVLSCAKALKEGRIECPEMPHAETLRMMGIMDEVRRQMDVVFPQEEN
ncbi:MAG: Gfo/Idh/MocA family oxidoreductase [Clostridium sp.]|nr:Gfo/Idh/MocA family oxidoreductase [Clostridium sp.]